MTPPRPWIAYVGPVPIPEGGAAARRILGNAKAFEAAGYDVVIVSGQPPGVEGPEFPIAPGINCVSVNERDAEHLPKALRHARYVFMGSKSRKWFDEQPAQPAAIILYSGYSPYLMQFTGWARRKGIPLIFDAVEWYTAPSVPQFILSPYLWNTELAMRVLIPRLDGVIAISRALETYYAGQGLEVVRTPPLFDPDETRKADPAPDPLGRIRLAYAGTPGHKDLLDVVIQAVLESDGGSNRFVLDIVGVTDEELARRKPLQGVKGGRPACIQAHGRVSHARAVEFVGQADFSVFLREVNRVSTCGFPTKFVESLALGTPVITNLTSDLGDHLRDGENGLVCPSPDVQSLKRTLDKALSLSLNEKLSLRTSARAEAERAFAYRMHIATLAALIDRVRKKLGKSGLVA